MLQPLRNYVSRARVSQIENFPAPIEGWAADNTFNSQSTSAARILQNLVPSQNTAYVRGGFGIAGTVTGQVESLMSYESGPMKRLLAAAAGKVYRVDPDALAAGTQATTELATGMTNSRWQYVNATNAADEVMLVAVNGANGIWKFNGTTFVKHTPTNEILSLSNVTSFKGRLWFTELNSPTVWYGEPLANVPVGLTPFPVGPFLRKGGSIVCIDSMSVDGGSGPDDFLVMASNRGEIIMWKGIDPADDMSLVGVFSESPPMGPRCMKKLGTDLIYFSQRGPNFLTALLPAAEGLDTSLVNPIKTEFERYIIKNALAFGWDFVSYSMRSWVLFNIPDVPPFKSRQFVLNIETQAWFEIIGWNGLSWVQHDYRLFFGDANGRICVGDYGQDDGGQAIDVDYMQSWYEFKTASKKKFNLAQITIKSNVKPDIAVDMMVDYEELMPQSTPEFALKAASSPWDVSPWNTSPWSGTDIFYVKTFGLTDLGFVGALRYRASLKDSTHELFGFRIAFEEGEIM